MEDLIQKREKEKEYIAYINEHLRNVKTAWENMKNNDKCMVIIKTNMYYDSEAYIMNVVETLVNVHDRSKLSSAEFDAYRKYFYPINDEEKKEVEKSGEFDKAWVHHYTENLHHWDHWKNDPDSMSFICVLEMTLDWIAMSIKFNNNAIEWYEQNKKDIVLGEKQEQWVMELLNAYYEK